MEIQFVDFNARAFKALCVTKAGKIKGLFVLLDKVWGSWIDQGYIRYPENFSISEPLSKQLTFYGRPFGLSLCHGANGVPPVIAVLKGILGFSVSEDGSYTISPNLMNLQWAKGRIPTPYGYIYLSMDRRGTNTIKVPSGCKIALPKESKFKVTKY